MSLSGKIALVTGASRGIGKGIALQLGEAGAIVYITGRTVTPDYSKPGSLTQTADEIKRRGGKAIPVECDHSKDDQVEQLFQRIERDQGRLDILVNNAYSAVEDLLANFGKPFWEIDESIWDSINNVGLRNHYICAVKAAKMMTKQRAGLIVNISTGADAYAFTPAFGIGKAACDRMTADCGLELKRHNVTFVSIQPAGVKTELLDRSISSQPLVPASTETLALGFNPNILQFFSEFSEGESIEFSGRCVVALAIDPNLLEKTGAIFTTASIGDEYGLLDIDGRKIPNCAAEKHH